MIVSMFLAGARVMIIALLPLLVLVGCVATTPSPEILKTADYGPSPDGDYEARIQDKIGTGLKDPYSAMYVFDKPHKGYTRESMLYGTAQRFGWVVCGYVNAKNSFGAYIGNQRFFSLVRGEYVIYAFIGNEVAQACARRV